MFRIAPLALSLLFLPIPLRAEAQDAQPSILTVEVVSDDRPLAGASVVVSGRTMISGVDGRAVFDLPSGEYDISAAATGHLPATRHVVLTAQGLEPVRIALSRIPELEESVIVTATRTNTRLQDQPVRVEVIDREDIEEKALMTPGQRRHAPRRNNGPARADHLAGSRRGERADPGAYGAITHSSSQTACRCTARRVTRSAFCRFLPRSRAGRNHQGRGLCAVRGGGAGRRRQSGRAATGRGRT